MLLIQIPQKPVSYICCAHSTVIFGTIASKKPFSLRGVHPCNTCWKKNILIELNAYHMGNKINIPQLSLHCIILGYIGFKQQVSVMIGHYNIFQQVLCFTILSITPEAQYSPTINIWPCLNNLCSVPQKKAKALMHHNFCFHKGGFCNI